MRDKWKSIFVPINIMLQMLCLINKNTSGMRWTCEWESSEYQWSVCFGLAVVNQMVCHVFINTYSPVIKPMGHWHTCVSPQTPCACRSRLARAHYQGDEKCNLQLPHWPSPQLHLQRDQHKERESIQKSTHESQPASRLWEYVNSVTFLSCVLWSLSSL